MTYGKSSRKCSVRPLTNEGLAAELAELQANLDFLSSDERRSYEFSGGEGVPLEQAMHLMDELQKVDKLQEQLEQVGRQGPCRMWTRKHSNRF